MRVFLSLLFVCSVVSLEIDLSSFSSRSTLFFFSSVKSIKLSCVLSDSCFGPETPSTLSQSSRLFRAAQQNSAAALGKKKKSIYTEKLSLKEIVHEKKTSLESSEPPMHRRVLISKLEEKL